METENRLIDANVVLAKKFTTGLSDAIGNYYGNADVVFADDIENAPTVDAVKVVRCRDCKWYMPGDLFKDIMFCHRLKKDNGKPAKYNYCADDFCSYGERKDGDGNG